MLLIFWVYLLDGWVIRKLYFTEPWENMKKREISTCKKKQKEEG